MLTRTADSLYWMSRNIERSEKIAGLLATELTTVLETSNQEEIIKSELETIVSISASEEDAFRVAEQNQLNVTDVTNFLLFSEKNPNSIYNCVRIARENARTTRDHLSDDFWMIINGFHLLMNEKKHLNISAPEIQHLLHQVKMTSLSAQGIIESTVTRGNDYRMIKIGKWIERADFTVRILLALCKKSKENPELSGYYMTQALQFVNGSAAYLREHQPIMHPSYVIEFILNKSNFPCSILYCVEKLLVSIKRIDKESGTSYSYFLTQQIKDITDGLKELEDMEMELSSCILTFNRHYEKLQVS
ncbi:alpha-E domain-containing protein [Shouchella sp. JSM 1781072]|uniref:alpha-E domain-containing protein n=1 Tax=Bacillaceae TaxID=186817 RepID=UPI0020D06D1A|nr:alpha-E domain-containing protein [Alkalihalobacillus sp. LMS6]UTR04633.1 alpha-E domain-containing protein [Alkalihalobacillus sp. LMS6]